MTFWPLSQGRGLRRRWASVAMPTALVVVFLIVIYWQRPPSSQMSAAPAGGARLSSLVGSYKPQGSDTTVALLAKQVKEMKKEIEALRRKSWAENLEPQFHFRSRWFLGKGVTEDRSHVEPFFLGHMLNTTEAKRRVYIDLGMNSFDSSLCYMLITYPALFNEIHAFECCNYEGEIKDGKLPPLKEPEVQHCLNLGHKFYKSPQYTTKEVIGMTRLYWSYIDTKDDRTAQPPKIAFNSFLDSLKLTEDDFVVVKMDIEGMEYDVLKALLAEPRLSSLVDELMVEVHYSHPEMEWAGWNKFAGIDIADAHVMVQKAREAGIVVHPWP